MRQPYTNQNKELVVKKHVVKDDVLEGSWDLEDDDFPIYYHAMPLLQSHKFARREWILKRFHEWYV
jgi:hypothetical protein